jgi:hypothetical protein
MLCRLDYETFFTYNVINCFEIRSIHPVVARPIIFETISELILEVLKTINHSTMKFEMDVTTRTVQSLHLLVLAVTLVSLHGVLILIISLGILFPTFLKFTEDN